MSALIHNVKTTLIQRWMMRGLGHILQIYYIPSFESFIKFMIESAAVWPSTNFYAIFGLFYRGLSDSLVFYLSHRFRLTELITQFFNLCWNRGTLLHKCPQKFTSAAAGCLDKPSLLQLFVFSTFSSSQPAGMLLLLLLVLLVTWYFEFAKLCALRTLMPYMSYAPYLRGLRALSTCFEIFLEWICTSPKTGIFPRTMVLQTMLF